MANEMRWWPVELAFSVGSTYHSRHGRVDSIASIAVHPSGGSATGLVLRVGTGSMLR
jgi:hypothetical protein